MQCSWKTLHFLFVGIHATYGMSWGFMELHRTTKHHGWIFQQAMFDYGKVLETQKYETQIPVLSWGDLRFDHF